METALRLGVLGCADIAWRRTLPAACAEPGIRLTAVGSRSLDRARTFTDRFGGRPYGDYRAVLAADDVDVVYVALPNALHAPFTREALLAGRHVLVEKPATTTADDARSLVSLARSRGLVLMENFAFLNHRQHATVRRIVSGGALGAVRSIRAEFGIPPRPATDIRYRAELGGGALNDVGVYPLCAAQALLGPDLTVLGAHLRHDPRRGVDVDGTALLATPAGVSAQLSFGLDHRYRSGYQIWGSAGFLSLQRAFTAPPGEAGTLHLDVDGAAYERRLAPDDQFRNLLRSLISAVRGGATGCADLVRRAELLDAVRHAATPVTFGQRHPLTVA